MEKPVLIGPFTQILPMSGLPIKGALKDEQLPILSHGGILLEKEKIVAIGKYNNLKTDGITLELIKGHHICMPGIIDAHTHLCYGGSRAQDYAMRNSGKSYLEIAKAGGGIWDTVTATRKSTEEELIDGIVKRSQKHLNSGTTTLEVKSGYGLTLDEELKMLRAIAKSNEIVAQDLIPTCLAAHITPKDWEGNTEEYLKYIADNVFPILQKEKLANRIDAFIEKSAFSAIEIIPYLEKAKSMGFDITIHADQFSTGGSEIAVRFEAVSADHLEASTKKEIDILAESDTTVVALPGASIGLGCKFTPARKLLDAGASLAIATDHNPGSAPMGDLITQASILGTFEKLTNAEVLAGITLRAAHALRLNDRGVLAKGHLADFISYPTNNYQEITYQQGQLKPSGVWKNGVRVVDHMQ